MEQIKVAFLGNLSYDYNYFRNRDNEDLKEVMNYGGATLYSGIPASLFERVAIVAKVGEDYNFEVLNQFNIDISNVKKVAGNTTKFTQEFTSDDGQLRIFKEYVNPNTVLLPEDIPDSILNCDYIHICTNYPKTQLDLVRFIKNNSNAKLSIDTLEDYYYDKDSFKYVKNSFDLVDIAFIDKEFTKLYDCEAPIKIIKLGKEGCRYISEIETFDVSAPKCDFVVDKTGAGDCVTGVFVTLKSLGYSNKDALSIACYVATESIKDYGMAFLKDKTFSKILKKHW